MIVHLLKPDKGFTILDNRTLQGGRNELSPRAQIIHTYLLSCSQSFNPTEKIIAKIFNIGQSSVCNAIRELKQKGYLVIYETKGRKPNKWVVYEFPVCCRDQR